MHATRSLDNNICLRTHGPRNCLSQMFKFQLWAVKGVAPWMPLRISAGCQCFLPSKGLANICKSNKEQPLGCFQAPLKTSHRVLLVRVFKCWCYISFSGKIKKGPGLSATSRHGAFTKRFLSQLKKGSALSSRRFEFMTAILYVFQVPKTSSSFGQDLFHCLFPCSNHCSFLLCQRQESPEKKINS